MLLGKIGSTSILHDSEGPIDVGQCWDAGCYSRSIQYNATMRQMIALSELSSTCKQSIQVYRNYIKTLLLVEKCVTEISFAIVQYNCKIAPMEFNGEPQSWWTDRYGVRHNDFTGGNSSQSKCQCALDNSCLDRKLQCNCNALSPIEATDTGKKWHHFIYEKRNNILVI